MKKKNQVAVVIPFYKPTLTYLEEIAFRQCLKILSDYPIIAIKPNSLETGQIANFDTLDAVEIFDNHFFDNVQSYNELMLSSTFYQRFLDYEFILIHQLDAFVFRNELSAWCDAGFDYIGAPWLKRDEDSGLLDAFKTKLKTRFYTYFNLQKYGLPSDRQFDNVVGNGGFSLRKVDKFHHLANISHRQIGPYLNRSEFQFHEDVFWSIEVNRKQRRLRIPDYKSALKFSFENKPERALKISGNKTPFGCHAWDLHLDFWMPYFSQLGYDITSVAGDKP